MLLTTAFWRLEIVSNGSRSDAATRADGVNCGNLPGMSIADVLESPSGPMHSHLLKRFEDEIHGLERELKTELPKEIQRARELGDLRENAEYQAALERQTIVKARIGMLRKRVSEVALMNLARIPTDRAAFGSTVHLREANGDALVYQLVMAEDADATRGWISTASPIGRALLNKEVGDRVKVPTPGGTREFDIVKLVTIHDE